MWYNNQLNKIYITNEENSSTKTKQMKRFSICDASFSYMWYVSQFLYNTNFPLQVTTFKLLSKKQW
jgi:hemolysin activation/secretion protein